MDSTRPSRFAIYTAILRADKDEQRDHMLFHASSLLSIADQSHYLLEEEAKRFLFVGAVAALDEDGPIGVISGMMLKISDLASKHLNAQNREHVQMAQSLSI